MNKRCRILAVFCQY